MNEMVSVEAGVHVAELDSSVSGTYIVVSVNGRHYQLSGLARQAMLRLQMRQSTPRELQAYLCTQGGVSCNLDDIERVLERLASLSMVQIGKGVGVSRTEQRCRATGRRGYLAVRLPLLSEARLSPLTSRLAVVFSAFWMVRLIPVMLIVQAFMWRLYFHSLASSTHSATAPTLLLLIFGNYVGLLLHELGHAAACVKCGVRHGPIGFGIYLIFPAFYTDVSEAWRLPRFRRMVVDAGGIYVSLLLATAALLLFLLTRAHLFALLAATYDLTVFFSLNPFFRMDGYWLISDALGIQNLMQANRQLTARLLHRILVPADTAPLTTSIKSPARQFYLAYYLVFITFTVYVTVLLVFWYLPNLLVACPRLLHTIISDASPGGPSRKLLHALFELALRSIPMVGLLIYLTRLLRRLGVAIARRAAAVHSAFRLMRATLAAWLEDKQM